jgi:chromate transporter
LTVSQSEALPPHPLREVAVLFLKLGVTAFGGPAAHVALMREEVVRRRRWVTDQQFLDLFGASNLIPGPTSTELAIYLGYVRAGWRGLVLAGCLFIAPATLMVLAIAGAYTRWGSTPAVAWALYGIKPIVIGIILVALWGLLKTAVKGPAGGAIALAALGLFLVGANPIAVLFGGGMAMLLIRSARLPRGMILPVVALSGLAVGPASTAIPYSPGVLALYFLKIGAVVYGSGYVLLAFLRADLVERLGWLSDRQLIDAVAVGQFTPGPVFTTATFIGYLVGGLPGALVATGAIFVPSFVFVAVISVLLPRLRKSPAVARALEGINVAALGLMGGVTWQLARTSIVDPLSASLVLLGTVALGRFRVNSAWMILGGGIAGFAAHVLGWAR